jgi:hypothetical protein
MLSSEDEEFAERVPQVCVHCVRVLEAGVRVPGRGGFCGQRAACTLCEQLTRHALPRSAHTHHRATAG